MRRLVVIVAVQLSHRPRYGHRQLAAWVDLAEKYLGHGLSAIHSRLPCLDDCRQVVGGPFHSERAAIDQHKHCGLARLCHLAYKLLLQSHEADVAAVGVLAAGAVVPPVAHHVFTGHHNVKVGRAGHFGGTFHTLGVHVARVPPLAHIYHLGIAVGHAVAYPFEYRHHVLGSLACRPVAHYVLVLRIDAGDENFAVTLCIERQQSAFVLQQHYALPCGFERRAAMLGAQAHLHGLLGVGKGMLEQPEAELISEYAARTIVDALLAYAATAHKVAHGGHPSRAMHVHVHSGIDALVKRLLHAAGGAVQVV